MDALAFFGKFLLTWAAAIMVGLFFLRYMEIPQDAAKTVLGSFAGVFIASTLGWIK